MICRIIKNNLHSSGSRLCLFDCINGFAGTHVLSWEVSVTMDDEFCVNALKSALRKHQSPEIFNTDQRTQFTGKAFTGALKDHGVQISMDGKGKRMDNIFLERYGDL
jgi:transposase InsO family protein